MKEQKTNGHTTSMAAPQVAQPPRTQLKACTRVYTSKAIMCGGRTETTLHKIPGLKMAYSKGEGVVLEIAGEVGLVPIGNLCEIWFETPKEANAV